jgi:1-acyl-sn-glycerol-3-phosphate acyltransferase
MQTRSRTSAARGIGIGGGSSLLLLVALAAIAGMSAGAAPIDAFQQAVTGTTTAAPARHRRLESNKSKGLWTMMMDRRRRRGIAMLQPPPIPPFKETKLGRGGATLGTAEAAAAGAGNDKFWSTRLSMSSPASSSSDPAISTNSTGSGLFRQQSDINSNSNRDASTAAAHARNSNGQTTRSLLWSAGEEQKQALVKWQATLTKMGMLTFIASMCLALPLTLLPQKLLYKLNLISRVQKENWALHTGQFCARTLLRLIPFCKVRVIGGDCSSSAKGKGVEEEIPEPCVWVCNHQSMLDVFILLATDKKLRGPKRRQIKIVYWKNLEDNPVTKLLFRQCGFIPVAMAANKPGEDNEYDKSSFRTLLKDCKQAFADGFDIALLPEGQLNPTPERGLLPIFGGAYTLAKLAKRPVAMIALHGVYRMWHPDADIGMTVSGRDVAVRRYRPGRVYGSAEEFKATFRAVVEPFGTTGRDLLPDSELQAWLSGEAWTRQQQQQQN